MHAGNSPADRKPPAGGLRKALDPYIKLLPYFGIGLVALAIATVWIFWMQRGAHMELRGSIQKVRTLAPEETGTVAIIDFRFRNTSDYAFVVREIQAFATAPDGQEIEGQVISDVDARRLFEYYPALGQKYNETLLTRANIPGGESVDRMLTVRFPMPEAQFNQRKQLRIHLLEMAGPKADILEKAIQP